MPVAGIVGDVSAVERGLWSTYVDFSEQDSAAFSPVGCLLATGLEDNPKLVKEVNYLHLKVRWGELSAPHLT